jgi:cobalamin 5'-phosphate synthase/cobalamin synthase
VRSAIGFLTPLGGASTPTAKAVRWFPAVGLLIGAVLGGAWRGAEELWPPAVAAAVVVVLDLVLTGMLHVDGLVDSADGLLPHLSEQRRLEVMQEPTIGAFGVTVVAATLLLRWSALASMEADIWLLAGLWCLSRTAMVAVMDGLPYARAEGLASAFAGEGRFFVVPTGALVGAAVVGVAMGWPAIPIVFASGLTVVAIAVLASKRIGGFTGDVIGAAAVLAETIGLVVAAASW